MDPEVERIVLAGEPPSRAEIQELRDEVHELRREVRDLRRILREMQRAAVGHPQSKSPR